MVISSLYRGVTDAAKIFNRYKFQIIFFTIFLVTIEILSILLIFWMRMDFRQNSIRLGIHFFKEQIRLVLIPKDTLLYFFSLNPIGRGEAVIRFTPLKLLWIIAMSLVSSIYLAILKNYLKLCKNHLKIIKPGIVGIGTGSLGSTLLMGITIYLGCCWGSLGITISLVGGKVISTFGITMSIVSFIGLLLALLHLASKIDERIES